MILHLIKKSKERKFLPFYWKEKEKDKKIENKRKEMENEGTRKQSKRNKENETEKKREMVKKNEKQKKLLERDIRCQRVRKKVRDRKRERV